MPKALSVPDRAAPSGGGLIAIFCGVFLIGILGLFLFYLKPWWQVVAAKTWREVPCEIVHSRVVKDSSSEGDTYSIDIQYRYYFDESNYIGQRYSFFNVTGRDETQNIVDTYPFGSMEVCFVDPENPQLAVLNKWLQLDVFPAVLLMPCLAIGFFGLRHIVREKRGLITPVHLAENVIVDSVDTLTEQPTATARPDAKFLSAGAPEDAGAVKLEAEYRPEAMAKALGFSALVWNSIVIAVVFYNFRHGWDLSTAVLIFGFGTIGCALAGGTGYYLLSSLNPWPHLTLSRSELPLGQSAEVSWRFDRCTKRIRCLKIVLKGQEKATYDVGTTSATDVASFYRQKLFESTDSAAIADGGVINIEIPSTTMHSFKSRHNEILWSVVVEAEVAWWPNFTTVFPFQVRPQHADD